MIAFIAAAVVVADLGLGPRLFGFLQFVPGGDKTGHFVLMGSAALLLNLALGGRTFRASRLALPAGSCWVAAAATLEEFSQLALAARGFSAGDLAADYAGILILGALAKPVLARRAARDSDG